MIAIPNIGKSKSCTECPFEVIDATGYPRCVIMQETVVDGNLFNRCPLIDIVQCGECKYWYKNSQSNTGGCSVMLSTGLYAGGFCSYGERRADEHTD